jgi:hypothetical protein
MAPSEPFSLRAAYQAVRESLSLDSEDLDSDGFHQTRWERNVRNLLQYRITSGHLLRTDRGEYQFVVNKRLRRISRSATLVPPWFERSAAFLHERLLDALGTAAIEVRSKLRSKPLLVVMSVPVAHLAAFYVYLATDHPSERSIGDFRIQVILPGHRLGRRARFDRPDEALPYLVGFVPDLDVFILWDAALHEAGDGVPYSKGVQVHARTVFEAAATGMSEQVRQIRAAGKVRGEIVIAARSAHLIGALHRRQQASLAALLADD